MKKLLLSVSVAALACAGAQATVFTVTMTGTVVEGVNYGDFGDVLGDMTGQYATITGIFDTDLMTDHHTIGTTSSDTRQGPAFASITVNGVTRTIEGDEHSSVSVVNYPHSAGFFFNVFGAGNTPWIDVSLQSNGNYNFPVLDVSSPIDVDGSIFSGFASAYFGATGIGIAVDRLVITDAPPAGVPEPASWAMMIGGFGMVGGALRSRRKAAVSFG